MPGATTCRAYPYPLDTDLIDVAGDIQKLAVAVDTDTCTLTNTVSHLAKFAGGQFTGGPIPPADQRQVANLTIPFTGIWMVNLNILVQSTATLLCTLRMFVNGAAGFDSVLPAGQQVGGPSWRASHSLVVPASFTAGDAVQWNLINDGTQQADTYADPNNSRLVAFSLQ